MSITFDAEAIARQTKYTEGGGWRIAQSQTLHRIQIANRFDVKPGSKILEVGCGQGDFTVVLAAAVGETGHVTAVDPASLDYGNPFTLGQAQAHISSGNLGQRITWVQNDPITFLNARDASDTPFDLIVFANSLWYFSNPTQISDTLALAGKHARRVGIAEYSLHASPSTHPFAIPHIYAVFAQAALEVRKPLSKSNIRTVVGPKSITALAASAGLKLVQEESFTPESNVDDARWETYHVRQDAFLEEINSTLANDERERYLALSLREAMLAATADLPEGPKSIRMMDVWCAVFEKNE